MKDYTKIKLAKLKSKHRKALALLKLVGELKKKEPHPYSDRLGKLYAAYNAWENEP